MGLSTPKFNVFNSAFKQKSQSYSPMSTGHTAHSLQQSVPFLTCCPLLPNSIISVFLIPINTYSIFFIPIHINFTFFIPVVYNISTFMEVRLFRELLYQSSSKIYPRDIANISEILYAKDNFNKKKSDSRTLQNRLFIWDTTADKTYILFAKQKE